MRPERSGVRRHDRPQRRNTLGREFEHVPHLKVSVMPPLELDLLTLGLRPGQGLSQPRESAPTTSTLLRLRVHPVFEIFVGVDDLKRSRCHGGIETAELALRCGECQPHDRVVWRVGPQDLPHRMRVIDARLEQRPVVTPHIARSVIREDPSTPSTHCIILPHVRSHAASSRLDPATNRTRSSSHRKRRYRRGIRNAESTSTTRRSPATATKAGSPSQTITRLVNVPLRFVTMRL